MTTRSERLAQSLGIEAKASKANIIKEKDHTILKWSITSILVVGFITFFSLFGITKVDGHSMDPTLKNQSYVLNKKGQKPRRFDIVTLKEKESKDTPSKMIVKRVIGLPGDTVTVINGKLYVNSKYYQEDYLDSHNIEKFKKVNWTIQVPKNRVFVLGDNRDISKDSRLVGSFLISSIQGTLMV